jgi:uncharacterized protein (DUF952 family)
MRNDLIFHVVSRRKWPHLNKNGFYRPENIEESGLVYCVKGNHLQDYLNAGYKGRKNLLILVIDTSRLVNRFRKDDEESTVVVEDGINLDAILDKIRIDCSKEGTFDITIRQD